MNPAGVRTISASLNEMGSRFFEPAQVVEAKRQNQARIGPTRIELNRHPQMPLGQRRLLLLPMSHAENAMGERVWPGCLQGMLEE